MALAPMTISSSFKLNASSSSVGSRRGKHNTIVKPRYVPGNVALWSLLSKILAGLLDAFEAPVGDIIIYKQKDGGGLWVELIKPFHFSSLTNDFV